MAENKTAVREDQKEVDHEKLEALGQFIDALDGRDGVLIEVLHHAQGLFGYLPRDVQLFIARKLDIPGAEVFGVVSFYTFFTMKPPGKNSISVCMGTACFVRGAEKIANSIKERLGIASGETTDDGLFDYKDVRCVGACGLAPVVTVNDKVYGRVTEDDIEKILDSCRDKKE